MFYLDEAWMKEEPRVFKKGNCEMLTFAAYTGQTWNETREISGVIH